MDYTHKFDGRAADYAAARPSYAEGLFDCLFERYGLAAGIPVADVGAGTGLFTEQLLKRGCIVYAVEPNEDMRHEAESRLSMYGGFISIAGDAARTGLADHSVHMVTAAQAFHWFDKELFKNECKRILKENGTIAIMWNFLDYKKELEGKIIDIQKKYTKLTFNASEEKQRDEDIIQFFGENKYKLKIYENNYLQNYENFIGNQLSMSYSLKESDEKYNEYVSKFKKLFEEFSEDNMVTIHNNTYCYFGNVNG